MFTNLPQPERDKIRATLLDMEKALLTRSF